MAEKTSFTVFEPKEGINILYPGQLIGDKPTEQAIMVGRLIGIGKYSKCYIGVDIINQRKVCLKVYDKSKSRIGLSAMLNQEIKLHNLLNHERIVSLYSYFEDEKYIYYSLELCENNTLRDYLKYNELNEEEIRYILLQIIEALKYCHNNGIIYRDLKIDHIFFDKNMDCKLGDFSKSAKLTPEDENRRNTIIGNYHYISPDMLRAKRNYDFKVDIWALGVLTYYLFTKKYPSENGEDAQQHINNILNKQFELPNNCNIPIDAKSMIRRMLTYDPEERPTLDEILNYPFFTQIGNKRRPIKKPDTPIILSQQVSSINIKDKNSTINISGKSIEKLKENTIADKLQSKNETKAPLKIKNSRTNSKHLANMGFRRSIRLKAKDDSKIGTNNKNSFIEKNKSRFINKQKSNDKNKRLLRANSNLNNNSSKSLESNTTLEPNCGLPRTQNIDNNIYKINSNNNQSSKLLEDRSNSVAEPTLSNTKSIGSNNTPKFRAFILNDLHPKEMNKSSSFPAESTQKVPLKRSRSVRNLKSFYCNKRSR